MIRLNTPLSSIPEAYIWMAAVPPSTIGVIYDCPVNEKSIRVESIEDDSNLRYTATLPRTPDVVVGVKFPIPVSNLSFKIDDREMVADSSKPIASFNLEIPHVNARASSIICTYTLDPEFFGGKVRFDTDLAKYVYPTGVYATLSESERKRQFAAVQ